MDDAIRTNWRDAGRRQVFWFSVSYAGVEGTLARWLVDRQCSVHPCALQQPRLIELKPAVQTSLPLHVVT